ncbi:MAG: hypothetical protein AB1489_30785 [Acidobacteriota bacterium]
MDNNLTMEEKSPQEIAPSVKRFFDTLDLAEIDELEDLLSRRDPDALYECCWGSFVLPPITNAQVSEELMRRKAEINQKAIVIQLYHHNRTPIDDDSGEIIDKTAIASYTDEQLVTFIFNQKRNNDELGVAWSEFVGRCEQIVLRSIKRVYVNNGLVSVFTEEKCAELLRGFFAHLVENGQQALYEHVLREPGTATRYIHMVAQQFALRTIGVEDYDSTDVDVELTLEDIKVFDSQAWKEVKIAIVDNCVAVVARSTTATTTETNPREVGQKQVPSAPIARPTTTNNLTHFISRRTFIGKVAAGIGVVSLGGGGIWALWNNWNNWKSGKYVFGSHSNNGNGNGNLRPIANSELDPQLAAWAERFEIVDRQVKENKRELDPLLERGELFFHLGLYENARTDLTRWAAADRGSANHQAVQEKLVEINDLLLGKVATTSPSVSLHKKLQDDLDRFLSARAVRNVDTANLMALDMGIFADKLNVYGNDCGLRLLEFYTNASDDVVKESIHARSLRAEAASNIADRFAVMMTKVQEAREIFYRTGNHCEVELTDVEIARIYSKLGQYSDSENVVMHYLPVDEDKVTYPKVSLLKIHGENLSEFSRFKDAIVAFHETIGMAKKLEEDELVNKTKMLLVSIYRVVDDNAKAFNLGHALLLSSRTNHFPVSIQNLQNLGLSVLKLGYPALSEYYLNLGIDIATEKQQPIHLALTYSYLAYVRSELRKFAEADQAFTLAFDGLQKMTDEIFKARIGFAILGSKAKLELLRDNFKGAQDFYQQALEAGVISNHKEKIALSEMYYGLSICLYKQGYTKEAARERKNAQQLFNEARQNLQERNHNLTFVIDYAQYERDMLATDLIR